MTRINLYFRGGILSSVGNTEITQSVLVLLLMNTSSFTLQLPQSLPRFNLLFLPAVIMKETNLNSKNIGLFVGVLYLSVHLDYQFGQLELLACREHFPTVIKYSISFATSGNITIALSWN